MITPIPTKYRGTTYRSRTEARWAVFFDSLKIMFEYEKEGFDLGSHGWYLPDFYLTRHDVWIEIKPNVNSENKCEQFATITGQPIFLFFGCKLPLDCDGFSVSEYEGVKFFPDGPSANGSANRQLHQGSGASQDRRRWQQRS